MDNENTQPVTSDTQGNINNNIPDSSSILNNSAENIEYKLPEKFKSVNDLINSYSELEKKLGAGNYGSPESYKWELDVDEPDGAKLFREIAKDNNLSQDVFNKIVSGYIAKENAILETQKNQINEVKQKIGTERIDRAKNLIKSIGLNQDQLSVLDKFVTGETQFNVLETILKKIDNSVSTVVSNSPQSIDIEAELEKIYNQPDYRYNASKYKDRKMELLQMQIQRSK